MSTECKLGVGRKVDGAIRISQFFGYPFTTLTKDSRHAEVEAVKVSFMPK